MEKKGTLVVDRQGYQVIPDYNNDKREPFFEEIKQKKYGDGDGLDKHVENFLKCIREGGTPNASVHVGAKVATIAEMGNIAYRSQKIIHWDDTNKRFEEEEANKHLKVTYRAPWQLPKV